LVHFETTGILLDPTRNSNMWMKCPRSRERNGPPKEPSPSCRRLCENALRVAERRLDRLPLERVHKESVRHTIGRGLYPGSDQCDAGSRSLELTLSRGIPNAPHDRIRP